MLTARQRGAINGGDAAVAFCRRTGFTPAGDKVWQPDEDRVVIMHYPDVAAICDALPHRTLKSLRHRARQLGVARSQPRWGEVQAQTMGKFYIRGLDVGEISQQVGKSKASIWQKAKRLRMRRPLRRLRTTGIKLVDSVRERAHQLGYKMRELDEIAGTRCYFSSPRYINLRALGRVIPLLAGRVVVLFPADD